jgi:hypothetical protein
MKMNDEEFKVSLKALVEKIGGIKFGWLRRRHKLRLKAKADREERKRAKEAA